VFDATTYDHCNTCDASSAGGTVTISISGGECPEPCTPHQCDGNNIPDTLTVTLSDPFSECPELDGLSITLTLMGGLDICSDGHTTDHPAWEGQTSYGTDCIVHFSLVCTRCTGGGSPTYDFQYSIAIEDTGGATGTCEDTGNVSVSDWWPFNISDTALMGFDCDTANSNCFCDNGGSIATVGFDITG
jgi:hypothetical protein